jgi:hypothetical protein
MTLTFPKKPTRVVGITVQRNEELIERVLKLKRMGVNDGFRVAA